MINLSLTNIILKNNFWNIHDMQLFEIILIISIVKKEFKLHTIMVNKSSDHRIRF